MKTTNSALPPWKHDRSMLMVLRISATIKPEKSVFSFISTRSRLMLASVMAKMGALVVPMDSCGILRESVHEIGIWNHPTLVEYFWRRRRTDPSLRLINESVITTEESKATTPNSTDVLSEIEVADTRAIDRVRAETALHGLLEKRFCSTMTRSSKSVLPISST